jgi:hypothetical protein
VQAGLLAGMAVAAFFFVLDLVRLAPFSTPLFLSRSLLEAAFSLDSANAKQGETLLEALASLSQGGRLAAYTAVHLAVSAVLGMSPPPWPTCSMWDGMGARAPRPG